MSPTVTNKKTSFDSNANADYKPKTFTVGGEEIQAICLVASDGTILGTTIAPLRVEVTGTTVQNVSLVPFSQVQILDSSGNNIETDGSGNLKITGPISGLDVNIRDSTGGGISATSAALDVNLKSFGAGSGLSLDQKTMAGSIPVVIASNQSAVPVSGTFWQATQPVIGSFPSSKTSNISGIMANNVGWTRIATKTIGTGSTTTAMVCTAHTATVGDAVLVYSSSGASLRAFSFVTTITDANNFVVSPALPAAPANGDLIVVLRPLPIGVVDPVNSASRMSAMRVTIDSADQDTNNAATNLLKLEDAAHASGDSGVAVWGVRNDAAATLTSNDGDYSPFAVNNKGAPFVDIQSGLSANLPTSILKLEDAASANADAGVAVWGVRRDTPASNVSTAGDYAEIPVSGQGGVWTSLTPSIGGGLSTYHLVSAATTNATNVKASAGNLYGYYIYNSNAAARKVAFHNTAGTPTAGSSVFFSVVIPAGGAANVEFTNGIAFSTGIGITTTTGIADSDSAAVAANDLLINLFYK